MRSKLTQLILAEKVGVSRSAIYDWESEKYPPTDIKNIAALERELNFKPGELFSFLMYGVNPTQQVQEKKTA